MKQFLSIIAISVSMLVQAQSDIEALRYSMLDLGGSARFMGTGGAFTAVGGDLSAMSQNPAGLGLYRKAEMLFTPEFHYNDSESRYFSNTTIDGKLNFNINNFGFVFNKNHYDGRGSQRATGWVSTSFGFGYNRMANFNTLTSFQGLNGGNSLLDFYAQQAGANGGTAPSQVYSTFPYQAGLAYEAYLIDPAVTDTFQYVSRVPDGGVTQLGTIRQRGAIDEWAISFAGNYGNRWFVGATLGLPTLRSVYNNTYTENDADNSIADFSTFTLSERIETRGSGVNLKIGILGHLTDNIRVGAAVHSPTFFRLSDQFFSVISSAVTEGNFEIESPNGLFDYSLLTPLRLLGGVSAIFPQLGFISADYEYVNYSMSRFRFNQLQDQLFETQLNNQLRDKYQGVHSVRLGGEYVFDQWRFRGGFNYQTAALQEGLAPGNSNYQRSGFSLGLGKRGDVGFFDIAYVFATNRYPYLPYTLDNPDEVVGAALVTDNDHRVAMTVGFRF